MNDQPILEVRNLSYTYSDGTTALHDVNLSIPRGSRITVMGSNGSGKSTLFLCLNGVLRPTQGEIYLNGKQVQPNKKGLNELRRSVGIVFQDPDTQIFSSSVWNEVAFGPVNMNLPAEEVQSRVDSTLERLNLTDVKNKPPHFLSGGMKKRVSIADILAMKPEVILFDEPTSALDPYHASIIDDILASLHNEGCTIIVSTHDVDRAVAGCDTMIVMDSGSILRAGDPYEIFSDRDLLTRSNLHPPSLFRLFNALTASGTLPTSSSRPSTVDELITMINSL